MRFLSTAALIAVASGTAVAATAGPLEKKQITIAMGGKSLYYLPLTIAEQRGYFKDEGLDVTVADFAGGSKAAQALLGGSADVAAASYEYSITLKAKGVPIEAIVLLGRYSGMALAVSKKHANDFKSLKDLKGMVVGVTAPGSSTNMFLNNVLVKNGLKPSDVSVLGVGTTSGAIAAVRQGRIDAIVNLDPVISRLEQDGDAKVVVDARNAAGMTAVYGGPSMAGCLFVNPAFAKENPNTAQALVNAMVRSLRWIQGASTEQIMDTLGRESYGDDKALFRQALARNVDSFNHEGSFSMQGARNAYAVLNEFDPDVRGKNIDLSATFTNRFVQNVDAAHR